MAKALDLKLSEWFAAVEIGCGAANRRKGGTGFSEASELISPTSVPGWANSLASKPPTRRRRGHDADVAIITFGAANEPSDIMAVDVVLDKFVTHQNGLVDMTFAISLCANNPCDGA